MAAKSKILIMGGTGYIGKFIVEASVRSGHPTFALVRKSTTSDPAKAKILESFNSSGVTLVQIFMTMRVVKAIKHVDVVISTVGHGQIADQINIIAAIKEAGNIKRFFPSEFGTNIDRVHAIEPAKSAFDIRARIRRAIEAEGIPYTYVVSNCFFGYFFYLVEYGARTLPKDKVVILGDGNAKAVLNEEEDIASYTIKAVDDPRTLNKILYIKPPLNTLSFNELIALWENKIGKTLEKVYVSEEQVLRNIPESPVPLFAAISYSILVKGETNFEIHPSFEVEASELYPEVKYTSVDEYLNQLV